MKNPLVSIALATYNGELYLEKQLQSLIDQTYTSIEIIISDDGSTDKTMDIIKDFVKKDSRIHFSPNPNPINFKTNFERAILLCKGEIIFLCDQDDIWDKEKVNKHVEVYEDGKICWVYNEVELINKYEKPIGLLTDLSKDYYKKIKLINYTAGRCILGCATSYRRKYIINIWPIYELAPSHDSWIQLALYPKKSYCIKTILQKYRQHDTNVFGLRTNTDSNINENIEKSIKYVKYLYKYKQFGIYKRFILYILFILKTIKYKLRLLTR